MSPDTFYLQGWHAGFRGTPTIDQLAEQAWPSHAAWEELRTGYWDAKAGRINAPRALGEEFEGTWPADVPRPVPRIDNQK